MQGTSGGKADETPANIGATEYSRMPGSLIKKHLAVRGAISAGKKEVNTPYSANSKHRNSPSHRRGKYVWKEKVSPARGRVKRRTSHGRDGSGT